MEKKIDAEKETIKSRKKIARVFRWMIGLTLCLIIIAWAILWFVKVSAVVVGDGLVEPEIKIELRAKIKDATLDELLCEENESVKAGQIIARINDQKRSYELVEETKIKLSAEKVNLERAGYLLEKGLISEKEVEEIKTRLELLNNQYEIALFRLNNLTIQTPQDGKIAYLPKKPGETVGIGDLIALISGNENLRLRLMIESDDISRVSSGQKVEILWPGSFYRNLIVGYGHIVKIYPYAVEKQGRFYFEVLVDIDEHRVMLPLGVKLCGRIIGEKKRIFTLLLNSK